MKLNGNVLALVLGLAASHLLAQDLYPQRRYWRYSSARVQIGQTGAAATVSSPACGSGASGITAAQVRDRIGAATLDRHLLQQPKSTVGASSLTSEMFATVQSQENRAWLTSRLGVNGGASNCATQCVVYPRAKAPTLSVFGCLSETGGDGLDCGANGWNGKWMGVWNLTHADTTANTISCMTGKNWSHNRNRWFWVVASDVNPLNGSKLPTLYR